MDKMRGGRGSKNVCFCPRSGYKKCPRRGGGGQKWQNSVHVIVECPPVERTILHLIQYPSLLPLNPWKVFFSADLNNCNTGNRHHCYKSRTKCLSLFSLHYVAKSYRKSPLFQFLWFLKIIFYQLLVYPAWMNELNFGKKMVVKWNNSM